MNYEKLNPDEIIDCTIKIPLPSLEEQVGIIVNAAGANPEEAERVLKLGILNAVTAGDDESYQTLMQLLWNLFGKSKYNQFIGQLTVAALTGDFSKFL